MPGRQRSPALPQIAGSPRILPAGELSASVLRCRCRVLELADVSEDSPGLGATAGGGYTVTSPLLPELITEGDTVSECLANAEDAFAVVLEIYEDEERPLPPGIKVDDANGPVSVEAVVTVPAL